MALSLQTPPSARAAGLEKSNKRPSNKKSKRVAVAPASTDSSTKKTVNQENLNLLSSEILRCYTYVYIHIYIWFLYFQIHNLQIFSIFVKIRRVAENFP